MSADHPVIDIHIHYSPESLIQKELSTLSTPDSRVVRYVQNIPSYTIHRLICDLNRHIASMDFAGIDMAILSSAEGMRGDLEQCRAVNDALVHAMRDYSGRLVGMVHTDPFAGDAGLAEIERGLSRGLRGVAVPSTISGKGLDDPGLWPFYRKVEESGTFLFVHPALSEPSLGFNGFDAFDLYRTVGREFDLVLATLRLVLGGVMDAFPRLNVVMSHLSGGITALVGRIRNYQDKDFWGVAQDPVHGRTAKDPFDAYLSRLYFDTGGFFGEMTAVKAALLNIPPGQLLFGTDYPQEIRQKEQLQQFRQNLGQLELTESEKAGILGGNAQKLLKI